MDDLIAALKEAARKLNEADVPRPRFVFMAPHTLKLFRDKRYRGRMVRKGKLTKKDAKRYASLSQEHPLPQPEAPRSGG